MSAIEASTQVMVGLRPTFPENCDPKVKELLSLCWKEAPQDRPTFQELLEKLQTLQ